MTNIWEFLLQTMEVSLTAAILLLVKWLFKDKLSPRWQYAVWILLAAKILLPARLIGRYLSVTLAACLEIVKVTAEGGISSAYCDQWVPIGQSSSVIPYITQWPVSVTDCLFLIYIVGVLACLLWYGLSYLRLRRILHRGKSAESALQERIDGLCSRYALTSCRAVVVQGISSAFICGYFHPLLVIPAAKDGAAEIDDKILLHELLHRTYGDALQSVFWCLMRALHWCNPFLQYVFNRIGNDMESLCDQRVLELLEGEERREYGKILLSMTDEKYARAPGTTSISNGGKNIARRIEAITRFKKYPRGMALVSICVLVMLAAPVFAGTEIGGYSKNYPDFDFYRSRVEMAKARMNRCTTLAGAIDTWVKGRVFEQPAYLAAVTPYDEQEALKRHTDEDGDFYYEISKALNGQMFSNYAVYNLKKESDNCYTALAVLEGKPNRNSMTEDDEPMRAVAAIPLTLQKENGWTVVQSREIQTVEIPESFSVNWGVKELSGVQSSEARCKNGIVTIREQTVHIVDNQRNTGEDIFAGMLNQGFDFDGDAKRMAEFSEEKTLLLGSYQNCQSKEQRKNIKLIGMMVAVLMHMEDEPRWQFSDQEMEKATGRSGSQGQGFDGDVVDKTWNGYFDRLKFDATDYMEEAVSPFEGFAVRIYQNGKLLDTLKIKRGAKL